MRRKRNSVADFVEFLPRRSDAELAAALSAMIAAAGKERAKKEKAKKGSRK